MLKVKNNLKKKFSKKELNSLKNKIKNSKHKGFLTYDFLGSNYANIYFVVKNQIINCSINSLKGDYMSIVSDEVMNRVLELYPNYYKFEFVPCLDKPGFSTMEKRHSYNEDEVNEYQEDLYKEICKSSEISVRERIVIDYSYEYGIGVNVYINSDKITKKVCDDVIKFITSLKVLYEGEYFLGEETSFTYDEAKNHKLLGCAIDMSEEELQERIGRRIN